VGLLDGTTSAKFCGVQFLTRRRQLVKKTHGKGWSCLQLAVSERTSLRSLQVRDPAKAKALISKLENLGQKYSLNHDYRMLTWLKNQKQKSERKVIMHQFHGHEKSVCFWFSFESSFALLDALKSQNASNDDVDVCFQKADQVGRKGGLQWIG
jgi:hypothetical protein